MRICTLNLNQWLSMTSLFVYFVCLTQFPIILIAYFRLLQIKRIQARRCGFSKMGNWSCNSCAINWIIWFRSFYVRHQNLQINKLLIAFRNHNAAVALFHTFARGIIINENVFGFISSVLCSDTREHVYKFSNWRNVVDVIARFNSLENATISTLFSVFFFTVEQED